MIMDFWQFWTIVAAVALGYALGRFLYEWVRSTPYLISPGGRFLDELERAKRERKR